MKKNANLVLWFFIVTAPAFGADKDPRPAMHLLAKEISALQKFMVSDASFSAPENGEKIKGSLGKLSGHLNALQGSFPGDPALKANARMLASHMAETERLFASGNKNFARYMLQSSMQMCIACHTREKSLDFAWPEPEADGLSPLEKGNYYFATRQFEKGKEAFTQVVAGYPGNQLTMAQLRSALLSLAVYFARVKDDPKGASSYFGEIAQRKDIPSYLRSEVSAWAQDFAAWGKEKKGGQKLGETELVGAAKKLLASDDFSLIGDSDRKFHVRRLRASALLHRVLEAPGDRSPMKAQAILMLGQIYDRISYNLFFRFGEMYLKACVRDYPKSKVARDCYDALEQAVSAGFSGSSGTNVPDSDQVELLQLKHLAY